MRTNNKDVIELSGCKEMLKAIDEICNMKPKNRKERRGKKYASKKS